MTETVIAIAAVVQAISTIFLAVQVFWLSGERRENAAYEQTVRFYTEEIVREGNTRYILSQHAFHVFRAIAEGRLAPGPVAGHVQLPVAWGDRSNDPDDDDDAA